MKPLHHYESVTLTQGSLILENYPLYKPQIWPTLPLCITLHQAIIIFHYLSLKQQSLLALVGKMYHLEILGEVDDKNNDIGCSLETKRGLCITKLATCI